MHPKQYVYLQDVFFDDFEMMLEESLLAPDFQGAQVTLSIDFSADIIGQTLYIDSHDMEIVYTDKHGRHSETQTLHFEAEGVQYIGQDRSWHYGDRHIEAHLTQNFYLDADFEFTEGVASGTISPDLYYLISHNADSLPFGVPMEVDGESFYSGYFTIMNPEDLNMTSIAA